MTAASKWVGNASWQFLAAENCWALQATGGPLTVVGGCEGHLCVCLGKVHKYTDWCRERLAYFDEWVWATELASGRCDSRDEAMDAVANAVIYADITGGRNG